MKFAGKNFNELNIAVAFLSAIFLFGCTVFDKEHVSTEEVPLILGAKPNPVSRWRNTCVVETEQQLRSVDRTPVVHEFWYQTPSFDAPLFPPNLTQRGLATMNRCHIQGTYRLRADGYMVFSANSQDRPRGEGNRKWALNNCPSLPTSMGGGAHLFVVNLGGYTAKPGYAWRDQVDSNEETPTTQHIVKNVLLSVDDDVQPPDVGSLEDLWHPGGIDGVGDFVYVGFDDNINHKSYLKVFDMADPIAPALVGGRGFVDHMSQAFGVTDLPDGRILLAVVDTNQDEWRIHFYVEDTTPGSGEIIRHQFTKAGIWKESADIGQDSQTGFPFLKYQSLALLRECGSDDVFLVGVHNDRRLRCGGLIEVPGFKAPTRVDLYRIHFPGDFGPSAPFKLEAVLRRNMRDQNGEGCAGATAHVTPEGQILAYTIEHGGSRQIDAGQYPEGLKRWVGKVRFYEYSTRVAMARLVDGDSVNQAEDLCPDAAEDMDGFNDGDGCPDEDNDADGILDAMDRCPNKMEDEDGINDGDGCLEKEKEEFIGKRVVISHEQLFNQTDEFELSDAGLFLTTGLVNWWRENGEGDVCVLAHTNNYGNPEAEQAETEKWADIVERTLVDLGVPAKQINARGYGSSKPVIAPSDPDAKRLNIRIEFAQCIL
ncbi:MAG: OmpA family protein [Arenicellales bacterium]|nr:OmpA family protein [Arenicellales bacterium]